MTTVVFLVPRYSRQELRDMEAERRQRVAEALALTEAVEASRAQDGRRILAVPHPKSTTFDYILGARAGERAWKEAAALLSSPRNASASPGVLLEVTFAPCMQLSDVDARNQEGDVGRLKIVGLSLESVAASGGQVIVEEGAMQVEVTQALLAEVAEASGDSGPVLLSPLHRFGKAFLDFGLCF